MERATVDLAGYGVEATRPPRWGVRRVLLALSAALMLVNLYLIFMWAPEEAATGQVQRILYFHVPIAWTAFLAFFLVLVGSVMYLIKRAAKWDRLAHASAELGVLLASLILITGSIWGKATWGVWWDWSPRLTTSLILWLIYVAYLMVRSFAPTPAQAAKYSAALGIVGFVDVPIVYFAVQWWRDVHPTPMVGPAAGENSLPPEMRMVLMFSMIVFTLLFVYLLRQRTALKQAESDLRGLTHAVEDAGQMPSTIR